MTSREEALSRLLAGELSDDEARAWQDRIDTDPEVAHAWAALQQLVRDLESLPPEIAPPELDRAVVLAARRRTVWGAAPWALAAAILLVVVGLLARGAGPAVVTLGPGTHLVEGPVRVVAGAVVIDVNGKVRIAIEPSEGLEREPPGEEGPHLNAIASAITGAVAGAAVTVAVLEGTADVTSSATPPVRDGELITIPSAAPPRAPAVPRHEEIPDRGALARAERRIAQLEEENDALTRELEIVSGQLSTHRGTVQSWPADLAPAYGPDAMQQRMDRVFGPLAEQGVTTELDCAEYPCIMIAKGPAGLDVGALVGALSEELDDPAVLVNQETINYEKGPIDVLAFAVIGERLSADAQTRTEYRLATLADAAR